MIFQLYFVWPIDFSSPQEHAEKMAKRLKLMTQRCEALEKRRSLEVEGFRNDVKQLQQKLRDVEKQSYKVTAKPF